MDIPHFFPSLNELLKHQSRTAIIMPTDYSWHSFTGKIDKCVQSANRVYHKTISESFQQATKGKTDSTTKDSTAENRPNAKNTRIARKGAELSG